MLRPLVSSAVNSRLYLIRSGKSGRNSIDVATATSKFRDYLKAYPNATDEQLRAFLLKNIEAFEKVCPSGPAGKSIMKKVNAILYNA